MKSREKLMEQYEDALFAAMMGEIMAEEGEELLRENERLKADPDFAVPVETDRRCMKTIARAFGKQKRVYAARTAWRMFQRVSVAAFVGMVLFTGVYAASPEVRTVTLNLLIEVSDVATSMSFRPEDETAEIPERTGERTYELGELPDGFELTETGDDGRAYWRIYTNNDANIMLSVTYGSTNIVHKIDTENVDNIENIEVNENTWMLVEKDGRISAIMADNVHQIFIDVVFNGLSMEDALNVISGLTYTE